MPTAKPPPPPYQLVPGDKYNLTLGCITACALAACKEMQLKGTNPFVKWSFNAYTNWNLAFLGLRVLMQQQQWDPFLLVNSMGICLGFRTAFSQGLDESMRRKIKGLGFPLSRAEFVAADHLCHTAPIALLLASVLLRRQRVHPMNAVYALVLATWFSFRQSANLDASQLYAPHPWRRAWLGICVGAFATPPLVDAILAGKRRRVALCALALLVPYLTTKLDPGLKAKYGFEAKLAEATHHRRSNQQGAHRHRKLPRVQSETPVVGARDGPLDAGAQ